MKYGFKLILYFTLHYFIINFRNFRLIIRYDVTTIFIIFTVTILVNKLHKSKYCKIQYYFLFIIILFSVSIMLLLSLLAESEYI
jgi:hypothetical protein